MQLFKRDLLKLCRAFVRQSCQILVSQQRQQEVARADLRGAKIDRGDRPGLTDEPRDARRQGRGAGVTRLEPIESTSEIPGEPRRCEVACPTGSSGWCSPGHVCGGPDDDVAGLAAADSVCVWVGD